MNAQSIFARIITAMDKFDFPSPDKTNRGTILFNAYLWMVISKEAAKRYDAAIRSVNTMEPSSDKDALRSQGAGDYIPVKSSVITMTAKVTEPPKTFDQNALVSALNKKYKIPAPIAREMILHSTKPGTAKVMISFVET